MADTIPMGFTPRWYHRVPVLGRFARDLDRDFEGNVWYFLGLVAIAGMTWGLPALGLIALAMFVVLFVVTLG